MSIAAVQNDNSALLSALNGGSATQSGSDIGEVEDRFLKLLVTQLRNQDPMNPMENAELTSQLAQMSTVEGINKLNDNMATLLSGYQSSQTLQAAGLIGRQVLVDGDGLVLNQGQAVGGVELAQPADRLLVDVYKDNQVVQTLDLKDQPAGLVRFTWDGKDSSGNTLPDGTYRFAVNAQQGGERFDATPLTLDQVASVVLQGGAMQLELLGQQPKGLDQVRQIF